MQYITDLEEQKNLRTHCGALQWSCSLPQLEVLQSPKGDSLGLGCAGVHVGYNSPAKAASSGCAELFYLLPQPVSEALGCDCTEQQMPGPSCRKW